MSRVLAEGVVGALYRYPVESMQGEQIAELLLTKRGVAGDRALALLDRETGLVASAHHPGKWGDLLHCSAGSRRDGASEQVLVRLPDGRELPPDAELEQELSALLERKIGLIRSAPDDAAYEIVHSDVQDTAPDAFVTRAACCPPRPWPRWLPGAGPDRRCGRSRRAGVLADVA